jgi:hypothetical protein
MWNCRVRFYHIIGLCTFVAYTLTRKAVYISQYNIHEAVRTNFTSMLNRTQSDMGEHFRDTVGKLRKFDNILLDAFNIIKIE